MLRQQIIVKFKRFLRYFAKTNTRLYNFLCKLLGDFQPNTNYNLAKSTAKKQPNIAKYCILGQISVVPTNKSRCFT